MKLFFSTFVKVRSQQPQQLLNSISWRFIVVILIVSLYSIVSCKREQDSEFALIQTGEVMEIDSTGVVLYANILALGEEPILDYGFTWTKKSDSGSEKNTYIISLPGTPETGVFSHRLTSVVAIGQEYIIRSFIKNAKYTTYGREVLFTSLGGSAPIVYESYPVRGNLNDKVTILGEHFGDTKEDLHVYFGKYEGAVAYCSNDLIRVLVPDSLDSPSCQITVSVFSKFAESPDSFELISPVISSIDNTGTFGSEIEIRGANFMSNPSSLFAWVGGYKSLILEKEEDRLKIRVPQFLRERNNKIKVTMNNIVVESEQEFILKKHILDDFTPKNTTTMSTLTLTGSYFCPQEVGNIVSIGGRKCKVVNASHNELEVYLESQFWGVYSGRSVNIEVKVLDESQTYAEPLNIEDQWFRFPDAPLTQSFLDDKGSYSQVRCFVYEDKAYVGLNMLPDFWLYNPGINLWERLKDFPGDPRNLGAGFVLGDKIFFGTGSDGQKDLNDWWEYDIPSDSWTQKNDFAGLARSGAVAFQVNGEGYLGTGYQKHGLQGNFQDIWKYLAESDEWVEHTLYPSSQLRSGIAIPNSFGVYIGLGGRDAAGNYEKELYFYNPSSDNWEKRTSFPSDYDSCPIAFEMNDQVYIINRNAVHFYDESTSNWIIDPAQIRFDVTYGVGFSSGGIVYVGLGSDNQMWEFDPSR